MIVTNPSNGPSNNNSSDAGLDMPGGNLNKNMGNDTSSKLWSIQFKDTCYKTPYLQAKLVMEPSGHSHSTSHLARKTFYGLSTKNKAVLA